MLLTQLASWGNYEYLMRELSKFPKKISAIFQVAFIARIPLIIIALIATGVVYKTNLLPWMSVWVLSAIINSSLNVLIVYSRRFLPTVIIDFITFTPVLLWTYFNQDELTYDKIIVLLSITTFLKTVFLVLLNKDVLLKNWTLKFDISFYTNATFFFLIGLSGFLQSKSDLYVVNFFLNKTEVGIYQVVITAFIMLQSLSGLLLMPFTKNIYRLSNEKIKNLTVKFIVLGLAITIAGSICIGYSINQLYHFELPFDYFILGGLFAFPSFCYLPTIYQLYRNKQELQVMIINFAGALFNILFTYILIQHISIKGALIGSMLAQWSILIIYLVMQKSKNT